MSLAGYIIDYWS